MGSKWVFVAENVLRVEFGMYAEFPLIHYFLTHWDLICVYLRGLADYLFWSSVDTSQNSEHEHKGSNSHVEIVFFVLNISPDYKKWEIELGGVMCSVLKGCYYGLFDVDGNKEISRMQSEWTYILTVKTSLSLWMFYSLECNVMILFEPQKYGSSGQWHQPRLQRFAAVAYKKTFERAFWMERTLSSMWLVMTETTTVEEKRQKWRLFALLYRPIFRFIKTSVEANIFFT